MDVTVIFATYNRADILEKVFYAWKEVDQCTRYSYEILIDPYQVDALAEAMEQIATQKELRERLREKGLKRSRMFYWKNSARRLMEVYREMGKETG